MPCHRIGDAIMCIGDEPVEIHDRGKVYLFEWSGGCGWLPVNRDGSERLTPVPGRVWDALEKKYPRKDGEHGNQER